MVTIYIWTPPDGGTGHSSLDAGPDTYISYWPCEDGDNRKRAKKTKAKSLGLGTDGFAISESYEEDVEEIEREAEHTIYIPDMPTSEIKRYWIGLDSSSYNLALHNCSTVVARALLVGFEEYLTTCNWLKKILKTFEVRGEEHATSSVVAHLYNAVWTPAKVKNLARKLENAVD